MSYKQHKGTVPEFIPRINLECMDLEGDNAGLKPGKYPYEIQDVESRRETTPKTEYKGHSYNSKGE